MVADVYTQQGFYRNLFEITGFGSMGFLDTADYFVDSFDRVVAVQTTRSFSSSHCICYGSVDRGGTTMHCPKYRPISAPAYARQMILIF